MPCLQAVLQTEVAAQAERKARASGRAEKLVSKPARCSLSDPHRPVTGCSDCVPCLQAVLQKEVAAQAERKARASGRAEKLVSKLRQQRPQDAETLELDIELAQLRESNKALLQVCLAVCVCAAFEVCRFDSFAQHLGDCCTRKGLCHCAVGRAEGTGT